MRKNYLLINSRPKGVLKGAGGTSFGYKPGFGGYNGQSSFSSGTGFSGYNTQSAAAPSSMSPGNAGAIGAAGANLVTGVGANALSASARDNEAKKYSMDDSGLMDPNEKQFIQASAKEGAAKGMSTGGAAGSIAAAAGLGATIGSFIPIPGLGTLAGAGIGAGIAALAGTALGGAIGSLFGKRKGKKAYKTAQEEYNTKKAANARSAIRAADMARSRSLVAKDGIKTSPVPSFKAGGKLSEPGAVNIIAKGKLHKENNNLGNKDKGIPVIDSNGVKHYEIEKEELVLRQEATTKLETLVQEFNNTQDETVLESIGTIMAEELLTNTKDNSGKFKVKVK